MYTDSKMHQWNKEESPKLNPGIYGCFIYYKGSTAKQRVFSINGDGQVDNKWRKHMDPPLGLSRGSGWLGLTPSGEQQGTVAWDHKFLFPGASNPRQIDAVIMQRRTRDKFLAFRTEQRATETGMKLPDGNVEFVCFWLKHPYDGECWITPIGRFSLRVSSEDSHFLKSRSCFCPDGFTVPWTDLPSPIRTFLSTFMERTEYWNPSRGLASAFLMLSGCWLAFLDSQTMQSDSSAASCLRVN